MLLRIELRLLKGDIDGYSEHYRTTKTEACNQLKNIGRHFFSPFQGADGFPYNISLRIYLFLCLLTIDFHWIIVLLVFLIHAHLNYQMKYNNSSLLYLKTSEPLFLPNSSTI